MLPLRPVRAALLAFIGALVLVEAGSGLVAGDAWRRQSSGALSMDRREDLHQMLGNLRVVENLVVGAMFVTTIVWALLALYNATLVARGSMQWGAVAAALLLAGPVLFLAVRAAEPEGGSARLVNVMVQAFALYLPFWGLGRVADGVGAQKLPFLRWYLALGASFLVHELFTAGLDVLDPKSVDELGRTTMMFFINALVVGVMGLMAADATRSMDRSIDERTVQRRLLRDDASLRTRGATATGEQGATLPPPTPAAVPVTGSPAHGGVAVLDAPPQLAAPSLAPPRTAPVIAGPADGAMPLPELAAVQVPSLEPDVLPEVVTPAVAIPIVVAEAVVEPVAVELAVVEPGAVEPAVVEPVLVEPVVTEPVVAEPAVVLVEPAVVEPASPAVAQPEPPVVPLPAAQLPPPVPAPLPPPPPGARSSMPKLLTITEMRPIPVIEPEPEVEAQIGADVEPDAAPRDQVEEPAPVSGLGSMFQPLTLRKP